MTIQPCSRIQIRLLQAPPARRTGPLRASPHQVENIRYWGFLVRSGGCSHVRNHASTTRADCASGGHHGLDDLACWLRRSQHAERGRHRHCYYRPRRDTFARSEAARTRQPATSSATAGRLPVGRQCTSAVLASRSPRVARTGLLQDQHHRCRPAGLAERRGEQHAHGGVPESQAAPCTVRRRPRISGQLGSSVRHERECFL